MFICILLGVIFIKLIYICLVYFGVDVLLVWYVVVLEVGVCVMIFEMNESDIVEFFNFLIG